MTFTTRRSMWILAQFLIGAYMIGSITYLLRRPVSWQPLRRTLSNVASTQPPFYVTGPRDHPDQLTVHLPPPGNHTARANAGFVVLVRNSELQQMLESMYDMEKRFNHKFNYPWLFLNDEPFTDEFKEFTTKATGAQTHYGFVDASMWSYPPWIDQAKAARERERLAGVPYGTSESYRHMCRFQSGFFWRHPLLLELGWEYYWRVEPHVRYFCDLDYDPFVYMKENNKKYAFTISFVENGGTIPTLWKTTRDYIKESMLQGKRYFDNLVNDSLYRFITDEAGEKYNACHFWTNFEIARVDLWHTEAYQEYFNYLDAAGGFFYERWGDAPVHSIFAALFLRKDEVHYFHDIGYKHSIYHHCPESEELQNRCYCDPSRTLDYTDVMSCLNTYMKALEATSSDPQKRVGDLFA
ncbi:glycolipid 2-alpha-mannosyltransferase-domain-containing protein [Dichotomocladium elegans]|nr:glycolipid 2-alpha-mannosyltransferase-domain-containing protein [Dichotomocladium elegans]